MPQPSAASAMKVENMIKAHKSSLQEDYKAAVNENGVGGTGEDLAQKLEKIVSQVELIQKTL